MMMGAERPRVVTILVAAVGALLAVNALLMSVLLVRYRRERQRRR